MTPTVERLAPATDRAIERLTQPHTETTDGHIVEWPALIDWICDAVTEQVARGGTGSGDGRSPINEGALAILNRIKRDTIKLRAWLYMTPKANGVKTDLAEAWATACEYRAKGELDDEAWLHIIDRTEAWVSDIEAEWDDRPRRMELAVPCPACGERWILDTTSPREPKRRSAVVIEYAEGRAPVAECRTEGCERMWAGWGEVAKLGFTVGADQALDVLEACGIRLDFAA